MRRRGPLLVAAATGVGVLGGVLWMGARVPHAAVVAAAERALGRPFSVGRIQLRALPWPAVDLLDVDVPEAGRLAGCAAAFESERVRLRLALFPLVAGRAVVEGIDVEQPIVRLVCPAMAAVSESHGTGEGAAPAPRGPNAPAERATRAARIPMPGDGSAAVFHLRRLRVRGGRLQLLDEATATRWAIGRVDATAALGEGTDRAEVQVAGVLRRQGRALVETLDVEGTLRWGGRHPRLRGRVSVAGFAVGPLRVETADATLRAGERGVRLRDVVLRLGGGAVAGRARFAFGAPRVTALDVAGHGAALERAFDEAAVAVRGAWNARLALRGRPSSRGLGRRSLRGWAEVEIRDGAVEPFELGAALLDVVAPLRGRAQTQRLRHRYPDLFGARSLRFTRLAGTGRIDGGRVRTRNLVVRGGSYRARAAGSVGVDGALDLGLRLTLASALVKDLLGAGPLQTLVASGAVDGDPTIPLRLGGTIEHPRVRTTTAWSRAVLRDTLGDGGVGDLMERLLR
jgi:hypothetical protein